MLVLCIDRDDDVGRKAGVRGPVVGRKANLDAAMKLALADPEDSDANTIFEAVKVFDSLKKEGKSVTVATITGDRDVGVKSDTKLLEQLSKVAKKKEKTILITDGIDDERIMPLLKDKVEIVSVDRVVMKQSERLEGMYYMINDFINNPKMARLVFGLPAIIFLLFAFFGAAGWRIVLGGLGIYLLIKGFSLESYFLSALTEVKGSFAARKISFFFYAASAFIALVGLKSGIDLFNKVGPATYLVAAAAFVKGAIYFVFVGFVVAVIGRTLSFHDRKKHIFSHLTVASYGLAIALIAFETATFIINPLVGLFRLFAVLVFGFFVVSFSLLLERKEQ